MALPLLAELPALPLHEAGKYVAGAYVVLFALVLDLRGDHGDPPEPHRARARRAARAREQRRAARSEPERPQQRESTLA